LLALYPLLAYLLVLRTRQEWTRQEKTRMVFLSFGIATASLRAWYVYKQVQIAQGWTRITSSTLPAEFTTALRCWSASLTPFNPG